MRYLLMVVAWSLVLNAHAESATEQISRIQNEEEFRALDLNGDFFISAAEAAGHAEIVRGFDKADRNHDGKLSRAEFERLKKAKSAAVGGTAKKRPQAGSAAH